MGQDLRREREIVFPPDSIVCAAHGEEGRGSHRLRILHWGDDAATRESDLIFFSTVLNSNVIKERLYI